MQNDAILKTIQEKIDARIKNAFRMGDTPAEVEFSQIIFAHIQKHSIIRPLFKTVPKNLEESLYLEQEFAVNDLKSAPLSRRGTVQPQNCVESPLLAIDDKVFHSYDIVSAPEFKLSVLKHPKFSPVSLAGSIAESLLLEEEINLLKHFMEPGYYDNNRHFLKALRKVPSITRSSIDKAIGPKTDCIIMSPDTYDSICLDAVPDLSKPTGSEWSLVPFAENPKRARNVGEVTIGSKTVPIHLTEAAQKTVFLPNRSADFGWRIDSGRPLVIFDVDAKKLRAAIIAVLETGAYAKDDCGSVVTVDGADLFTQ